MEKVSVIVPVYNVEKYLPQCLDSIINQSYKNLEIICIDDGTPDNSVQIINQYIEKDKRITLISQKNQGLSGARNTGIEKASGKYITFVDSDDWIDSVTIESAVEIAEKSSADAVLWGYVREFGDKSAEKHIFNSDLVFDEDETRHMIHRRIAGLSGMELSNPENADSIVTAWGKLYKTQIIKEYNIDFVDTKIIGTEDALFNLYYFGHVKKSAYINKTFHHYRKDNESSLTRKYKPELFSQWSELYKRMSDYFDNNKCQNEFYKAFNNRICLSMIGLGLNELCNDSGAKNRIKNIKTFLKNRRYADAYAALEMRYFPLHWKVFFICCKCKFAGGVYILLKLMQIMIGR